MFAFLSDKVPTLLEYTDPAGQQLLPSVSYEFSFISNG